MKVSRILTFSAACILGGCAQDGYKNFYTPVSGMTPERIAESREGPAPASPQLQKSSERPQVIYETYMRKGYAPVGYSSFNGAAGQSDADAVKQGAHLGADLVVVVDPHYSGTRTGAIPVTTPTTQTSVTTGNATAYGSGGSATAYGTAVTTTYGSQTNYIPFSIDRFNYGAIYFIKRHYVFGANFRPLNDAERQQLQTNHGLAVTLVVDGTPAFAADILSGDILVALDGQQIGDADQLGQMLRAKHGQQVKFSINRNGTVLEKTVSLRD